MKKSDVIKAFGTGAAAGRAIGVGRARISKLPEDLPQHYVDRFVGAATRLGIPLAPQQLSEDQADGLSRPRSCA